MMEQVSNICPHPPIPTCKFLCHLSFLAIEGRAGSLCILMLQPQENPEARGCLESEGMSSENGATEGDGQGNNPKWSFSIILNTHKNE